MQNNSIENRIQDGLFSLAPDCFDEIMNREPIRVESEEELYELGMDEYLGGDGIAAVEWPDQCPDAIPNDCLEAVLEPEGEDARRITLRPLGGFREPDMSWLAAEQQEEQGETKA